MHSLLGPAKNDALGWALSCGSQGRIPGWAHRLEKKLLMSGLFGSRVLEAALAMASVYLLLAMFCSTVNEWIASLLAIRSSILEKGLAQLLGEAAEQFYQHPLIRTLMHDGSHPDHIGAARSPKP